jgi:predicted transcriptional regulator
MTNEIRNIAIEARKSASREKKAKAIALLSSGMSKSDIAKTLGVCKATVYNYFSGVKNVTPKIEKPKSGKLKPKNGIPDTWNDSLKSLITGFIQESVSQIIGEIPIQDIIQAAAVNAIKGETPKKGVSKTKNLKEQKPLEGGKQDSLTVEKTQSPDIEKREVSLKENPLKPSPQFSQYMMREQS